MKTTATAKRPPTRSRPRPTWGPARSARCGGPPRRRPRPRPPPPPPPPRPGPRRPPPPRPRQRCTAFLVGTPPRRCCCCRRPTAAAPPPPPPTTPASSPPRTPRPRRHAPRPGTTRCGCSRAAGSRRRSTRSSLPRVQIRILKTTPTAAARGSSPARRPRGAGRPATSPTPCRARPGSCCPPPPRRRARAPSSAGILPLRSPLPLRRRQRKRKPTGERRRRWSPAGRPCWPLSPTGSRAGRAPGLPRTRTRRGEEGEEEGGGGKGSGARFAAHFALALADLGLIPDPADPNPPPAAARRVVEAANAAIALHCVALIDSGSRSSSGGEDGNGNTFVVDAGSLLPPLAARAAAPFRRDIVGLRLRTLRDAPAEDAACALESLDQWLQGWASTVATASAAAASSAASSSSLPVSDIVPRELERHAAAAAASGRSAGSSREGPAGRAAAARWLWLSPRTLPAAAEHSCRVLRELFLSGGASAASAARALLAGLPAEPAAVVELSPTEILEAAEELTFFCSSSSFFTLEKRAPSPLSRLSRLSFFFSPPSSSPPADLRLPRRARRLARPLPRRPRLEGVEGGLRGGRGGEAVRAPPAAAFAALRAGAEALADDLPSLVASRWLQASWAKGTATRKERTLSFSRSLSRTGNRERWCWSCCWSCSASHRANQRRRRRGGGGGEAENDDDDDDSRYRLSSPEACAAGAAALSASLSAALPEGVVATAAPAEGADSGLVAVRVRLVEGGAGFRFVLPPSPPQPRPPSSSRGPSPLPPPRPPPPPLPAPRARDLPARLLGRGRRGALLRRRPPFAAAPGRRGAGGRGRARFHSRPGTAAVERGRRRGRAAVLARGGAVAAGEGEAGRDQRDGERRGEGGLKRMKRVERKREKRERKERRKKTLNFFLPPHFSFSFLSFVFLIFRFVVKDAERL